MVMPVINPPMNVQASLHRGTFVMRYSRTGPRLAARELIARRAATVVARRTASRGIAEQGRGAAECQRGCQVLKNLSIISRSCVTGAGGKEARNRRP